MKTRELTAGYIEPGRESDRAKVQIAVELLAQPRSTGHTIDHQPVSGTVLRFSITGTTTEAGRFTGGGQNVDDLRRVNVDGADLTLDECAELADLWDRWHLNDMRAACIHQAEAAAELYRRMPGYSDNDRRWALLRELPCPEGYKYGDEWLVEYLPPAVEQRIRQLTGLVEVPA